MSDAFKCDRCDKYGDEPAVRVKTHVVDAENYHSRGRAELCHDCADEYVAYWNPSE